MLPTERCKRFRTQRECLNAMDPYCGWNQQINECAATPNGNPRAAYWQQSMLTCPIMSDPVSHGIFLINGMSVERKRSKNIWVNF